MRKTMILGAAIAALLISAIPAEAGCLSGLFSGMQARRAARQQAMAASAGGACSSGYSTFQSYSAAADTGSCYSSQYAASAANCPTGNCPQTVSAAGYYSTAPAPQRLVQYVYTQAPAQAPAITSTVASGNCDANGDGKCDHCGMACNGATLPAAPPTPPTPPPLSHRTVKTKLVAFKPPDPIAPPVAYIPPAKTVISTDTMIAFR